MNPLRRHLIRIAARHDAHAGINQADDRINAALGLRPQFEPVRNAEHARIAQDLQSNIQADEATQDLHRIEDELTKHPPSGILLIALVFLFLVEILSCILLLRSLSFPNPERFVLGIALAAIIFFATGATVRLARTTSDGQVHRSKAFYLMNIIYILLIGSLIIVRYSYFSGAEDTSRLTDTCSSILLAGITCGPSWLAEWLMRRREPAVRMAKEARNLRRRIRRFRRQSERAQQYINHKARNAARWDRDATILHSEYAAQHKFNSTTAFPLPARNKRALVARKSSNNFNKGDA